MKNKTLHGPQWMLSFLVSVMVLVMNFQQAQAANSLSLNEAYFYALKNMESVQEANLATEAQKEVKKQVLSQMLPTFSGFGNYTKIDPPNGAGANPFLLTRQYNAGLRLSVPLFRGGALSAYRYAQESVVLSKTRQKISELYLYQEMIDVYFQVLTLRKDFEGLGELLELSRKRIEEVRQRTKLGRSRKAELVEAVAQKHMVQLQMDELKSQIKKTSIKFEYYTNMKIEKLKSEDYQFENIPSLETGLNELREKIKLRPDVLASLQEVGLNDREISVSKGSYYPKIDLTSNYYVNRTGVLSTSNWDASLSVSVPLFQGGGVKAMVKESLVKKRIARVRQSKIQRVALNELNQNYTHFFELKNQLSSVGAALEKAKESYQLALKDYRLGLVTNLDVLRSMNLYIDTKRKFQHIVILIHQNYIKLRSITGYYPSKKRISLSKI